MKLLSDGVELYLDLLTETLTSRCLLPVKGLLEDLPVGSDLRLRQILDLLQLIYGLDIHTLQLDRVVWVRLTTHCPREKGSVSTGSVKCGSVAGECESSDTAREYGMSLDLIALSDVVEDSQDEVTVTATGHQELSLA